MTPQEAILNHFRQQPDTEQAIYVDDNTAEHERSGLDVLPGWTTIMIVKRLGGVRFPSFGILCADFWQDKTIDHAGHVIPIMGADIEHQKQRITRENNHVF